MKRQVLIFDLDGTLIDSRQDLAAGINLMRRHYGLAPLPVATVTGFVGEGVRNLVSRSLQDAPPSIDLEEAVAINKKFYRQHIHDKTTLYPGVRKGLAHLAQAGHILALLSNKPGPASREILSHFEIETLFAAIIGGDSALPLKPHPDAVFAILRDVGGEREDAWMIGDNHTDIAVAHRAGIHSIFAAYGFGVLGVEKPERTVAGFDEVVRMFVG